MGNAGCAADPCLGAVVDALQQVGLQDAYFFMCIHALMELHAVLLLASMQVDSEAFRVWHQ
jgi:hypothetical protein